MGDIADYDADRLYDVDDGEFAGDHPYAVSYSRIIRETEKAWLFLLSEDRECWLPKSECELVLKDKEVLVPLWLVLKKEIREYA